MADSLHAPPVHCLLHISGVSVDFSRSRKNVESAEARIGKSHRQIERGAGKTLRQTFSPSMKLSLGDSFSLHVRHKTFLGMRIEHQDIVFDTEDMFRESRERVELEKQAYNKSHKNFQIVVELSRNATTEAEQPVSSSDENRELQPTTDEIIRICPRFRILVIGKTGVGKSSLINSAFGVEKALTSHDRRGDANIDTEFISEQNERFVLHDSKGFEPGEEDNLKIVQNFIERRKNMPALKDQLHAIWLCFEIPRAGGRLLETGTEEFLTLKRDGKLGKVAAQLFVKVPVIVVFTKFDMLIDCLDRTLDEIGSDEDAFKELVKNKADIELQDVCIRPLEKFAGPGIPHATISTKRSHKETLARLIKVTEDHVRQNFAIEASVMTFIAQRVDPELKFKASIEVGKKKYWKVLASCAAFKDRTMWDCLYVLHTDIVAVWNFHDPHHYLHSPEFRKLMVNMVNELEDGPTAGPNQAIAGRLSIVGTIAGILSALAGSATPIVVPIAAGIVLARWVYEVYQLSRVVLQRFMSYIVDLTLVLQILHLVSESQELSPRVIKLAVASYLASPTSEEVHTRIQLYDRELTLLARTDRDILDKVIDMMRLYSINAEAISKLRQDIPAVASAPDCKHALTFM
ncbi:uncharacterized protein EDB91DRAFT_1246668 [Suillus paluster]|uniref:uncharacterized protein n=1 Tax=Suillus paluster TaxID=48578 RepID=UPI001B86E6D1|nr:uncharacterized protein EDB91DRAFT_1246668 [Suillus paluster]KAG1744542.1 hypothetical protein EDB91DRAFT_1246668 [Suillus paluster]